MTQRRSITLLAVLWGLGALCLGAFLVLTQFNLVQYAGIAFLGLVLGIVILGVAGMLRSGAIVRWLASRRAAARTPLSPSARSARQTAAAVGVVLSVLFVLRDVLIAAFTDGPGPNDLGELMIGVALIACLLVALHAVYTNARNELAIAELNPPQTPQGHDRQQSDHARTWSQSPRAAVVRAAIAAAVALAAVYVLFNR